MKTFRAALIAVSCLIGSSALAQDAKGEHPCHKIETACTAAGFVKHEAKVGKGLFKDCVDPIVHGQAVAGVSVDPGDVQACVAVRAKHGHHGGEAPPQASPSVAATPPRPKHESPLPLARKR